MCGIFGVIARPSRFNRDIVDTAVRTMRHRGPDDFGLESFFVGDSWEVWLGHTRLSILDLSAAGHQPMSGQGRDGRVGSVVFNGEIYNIGELKSALLQEWEFRSHSDTEVLLAGILGEGSDFLRRMNGMWSFGVFDRRKNTLLLSRDRLGKKPLYYYAGKDVFVFASEIKAIVALGLPLTIDPEALAFYRWLAYIPAEMTVYRECRKLRAASFLTADLKGDSLQVMQPQDYWDPLQHVGRRNAVRYQDAVIEFLDLLDDATRLRMIADVPVGVFLSGGIDSTLVASSAAKFSSGGIKAYTVTFDDPLLDESHLAQETARQLGLQHQLISLTTDAFARQLAKLAYHYDEPFADGSQIPTMAIAEAARQHVTVVLTGDGGDELFLGYGWSRMPSALQCLMSALKQVPFVARLFRRLLNTTEGGKALRVLLRTFGFGTHDFGLRISVLNEILAGKDLMHLHDFLTTGLTRDVLSVDDRRVLGDATLLDWTRRWYPGNDWNRLPVGIEDRIGLLDLMTYLRDGVLTKVDRATMAYSLESRAPLLDYRIVEFGLSLPVDFKIRGGVQKRLLRDALATRISGAVLTAPKRGFNAGIPSDLPPGDNLPLCWRALVENRWRQQWQGAK